MQTSIARADLILVRGDTFSTLATVYDDAGEAVDLTGYTFTAQAKTAPGGTVLFEFSVEETDLAGGQFTLALTASQTAAMDFAKAAYDVKAVAPGGEVEHLFGGEIKLERPVTE